jgi:hypothetical protein
MERAPLAVPVIERRSNMAKTCLIWLLAVIVASVSSVIEDFKPTLSANLTVRQVANDLWTHFNAVYQHHVTQHPAEALPSGQTALQFIVAGFDPGSRIGEMFEVSIPSAAFPVSPGRTSNSPGPWWIGQADVVARIMNGYDTRIIAVPALQPAHQAGSLAAAQLSGLQYLVNWGAMTVQDAIDFATGMIQITSTIQKFTAGILSARDLRLWKREFSWISKSRSGWLKWKTFSRP